ncbi:DUF1002 domain-containing protein [Aceticella autotrophica]|uniref:DUF1002 domain-containing protein n=1 Tax=Aceticella autotrophica TaxID=2755338 RepID=A0A975GB18_9THEO|nr:DUF1002 domain-containing protein [Aceticella autotrophica]QSZ27731.1 DUF1002 domain-containing protein [Aceticella autotrophica]
MLKVCKKTIALIIVLLLFTSIAATAFADIKPGDQFVTFGSDLTKGQRTQLMDEFGIRDTRNIHIVEVTNQEEYKYLGHILPKSVIGTKAISSSLITFQEKGKGLNIKTNNITWVTNSMYKNALITAGITDASITVSAPYPVSGTAALTGIMKAFEVATGKPISDNVKKIANEEMVQTGQIGDKIGDKEKAVELMKRLKEQLSKQSSKLSDEQLRNLIENTAKDLGITLTPDEINSLVSLLRKLQNANIDWDKVRKGLDNFNTTFKNFVNNNPESKSLLWDIFTFFKSIIDKILNMLK